MKLAVIIVNYNVKDKLLSCLRSVAASRVNFETEVFIVDNASADGSVEAIEHFVTEHEAHHISWRFLPLDKNVGFAAGNNHAIKKTHAEFVLLLNPDTEVAPESFQVMVDYMSQNTQVGIAGCRIVKSDGKLDLACRRSFPNPVNSFFRLTRLSFLFPKSKLMANYNLTHLPEMETVQVDAVVGAFMMISRKALDKVGLLDERFFMYGEDLDWCWRVKEAGYKVMYYPKTTIIHHKGSASARASTKALYEFHRAMQIFFDLHYKNQYLFLTRILVYLGIWTRFVILFLVNQFRIQKVVSK